MVYEFVRQPGARPVWFQLLVLDAGLHRDLAVDATRLGPLAGYLRMHLPLDGSGSAGARPHTAGFDQHQVDQLVVTHLHLDHVGGLNEFADARPVVEAPGAVTG